MIKLFATLALSVISAASIAETKSPRVMTVMPDKGKPDAEYSAAGENLATDAVKGIYLTTGKDDLKMEIVKQTNEAIQFKVPGTTKPGRYSLMVLTADGKQFIEQPVKLTIE